MLIKLFYAKHRTTQSMGVETSTTWNFTIKTFTLIIFFHILKNLIEKRHLSTINKAFLCFNFTLL